MLVCLVLIAMCVLIQRLMDGQGAMDGPIKISKAGGGLISPLSVVPSSATFEDLLDAIESVESGGNANAVGDNNRAVGSFQIWKIYVDDVNRIIRLGHKDNKEPR